MTIAVLSGKGGTGKTMIATSLVRAIEDCQYLDCDVEEPNGFLFLKPYIADSTPVNVKVPEVRLDRCIGCGDCARNCQFHALASTGAHILTFPGLCHHCGTCSLVCHADAIVEVDRRIGWIDSDCDQRFLQGRLDVGEPVGVPIVAALKKRIREQGQTILDCAPGSSCGVVRTLEGCDYALLVAEPTPFGLHDFRMVVELVKKMGIRPGVVLNKSGLKDGPLEEFCREEGLPILLRIPYLRRIAEWYSAGRILTDMGEEWAARFRNLAHQIEREVVS